MEEAGAAAATAPVAAAETGRATGSPSSDSGPGCLLCAALFLLLLLLQMALNKSMLSLSLGWLLLPLMPWQSWLLLLMRPSAACCSVDALPLVLDCIPLLCLHACDALETGLLLAAVANCANQTNIQGPPSLPVRRWPALCAPALLCCGSLPGPPCPDALSMAAAAMQRQPAKLLLPPNTPTRCVLRHAGSCKLCSVNADVLPRRSCLCLCAAWLCGLLPAPVLCICCLGLTMPLPPSTCQESQLYSGRVLGTVPPANLPLPDDGLIVVGICSARWPQAKPVLATVPVVHGSARADSDGALGLRARAAVQTHGCSCAMLPDMARCKSA